MSFDTNNINLALATDLVGNIVKDVYKIGCEEGASSNIIDYSVINEFITKFATPEDLRKIFVQYFYAGKNFIFQFIFLNNSN